MNLIQISPSNPSSLKSRFCRRFLRSLMKIKTVVPTTSSSPRQIFLQRSRRIKIAADKSMALAAGKRAWSRAILWKIQYKAKAIRRRRPYSSSVRRICSCGSNNHPNIRNKRFNDKKKKKKKRHDGEEGEEEEEEEEEEEGEIGEANQLRQIVPGGEGMDLCSLLDETAHYLKCLITQVQVMRSIDQFYSQSHLN